MFTNRYHGNQEVDPGLAGGWNMRAKTRFISAPPSPSTDSSYMYGVLVVGRPPQGAQEAVATLKRDLEREALDCGLKLRSGGSDLLCDSTHSSLTDKLQLMKTHKARFALCVLCDDVYNLVKYVGDTIGITTQCVKWKKVANQPRGYCQNILLKIHTKIGGTNHTLTSRLQTPPQSQARVFQDPPASLSWVFDKHCMLVGIDVSHAEPGSDRRSVAAVVGSMNGQVRGIHLCSRL